eukprot:6589128-Prymnesium_polylepis.1
MSRRRTEVNAYSQNLTSSRSHAFLTMLIRRNYFKNQTLLRTETTTISLVDLAGSEKFDLSDKKGLEVPMGAWINSGLLALGKVLTALKNGSPHAPF